MIGCQTMFSFRAGRNKLVLWNEISAERTRENKAEFQKDKKNKFQALSVDGDDFKGINLTTRTKEFGGKVRKQNVHKESKYSRLSLHLMKTKRKIKIH